MLFRLIKQASLTEKVASQDGFIYLYRAMKFIGWIPPKAVLLRYVYFSWTLMAFGWHTVYLPLGFLGSYITQIKLFTPGEFLTSLQVCISAYGCSTKVIIIYSQLWRLIKARELLDKLDVHCSSLEEREKIHHIVARCNHVFLIFTIIYSSSGVSSYLSSVLSGHPPYQLYNPFLDWHDGTLNLWIVSTFEFMVLVGAAVQNLLSDTYTLVYGLILRTHLELLNGRISKLRTNPEMTEDENYEELVNCVLDHKLILEYCALIRPVISGTIFIQFLLIGAILGIALINLFFFCDLWTGFASVVYIVATLLQTFPFCYICNLVVDDCEALAHAIFQSNWIGSSPRYQSTLFYFLHNVQLPIVFIAGGIFPISMSSNISVAKFAFSVITIVQQINLADKLKTD
ncbi:odorant receptor 42b [Drosophila grimshawi]|uniref:Odorant receptor n=1 Tax=Drosophila grimshawi TaxID=7222 RepID=B4J9T8_DROGR|nr:odorant receptor 42b [Drosophila grimshawi]EDW01502.1 GH20414 [Drosophila grimshawi]